MAQTETSKIAATKAPPKAVVAPVYAYKIIATLGHLLVTTFVLASLAAWYYLLSPKAKLATFCLFIYGHYRYVRLQHSNWLAVFGIACPPAIVLPVKVAFVSQGLGR